MFNHLLIIPSINDLYLILGSFFVVAAILLLSQLLRTYSKIHEEYLRKSVHIFIGLLAAIAPYYFHSSILLIIFALLFGIFDWLAVKRGFFKGIHGSRFSYGTVYFPLAYIILLTCFWNIDKYLIFIGIAFFSIPDALAALTGRLIHKTHKFIVIKDTKSIEGSMAFFISGFLLLYISLYFFEISFSISTNIYFFLIVFSINVIAVLVETLSSKGSDNLFVPISVALITYIFTSATQSQINQIFIGILLALIMIAISHYLKFLTTSGLVMTFLLAVTVFGLGGIKWTIPILTFFILSSVLSKIGKGTKEKFKDTFEKTGTRDYAQVLANGGIAGVIVIISFFNPKEYFYLFYLISLAVANSDTWATEIGVFSKSKPRMITTFKKVEPGISGAISFYGTIGAFLGSLTLILSGIFFLSEFNLSLFFLLVISGFIGSLIDSFLGATMQAQYICRICEKYTEKKIHCSVDAHHYSGYKLLTNDLVNLSSAFLTIILFVFIYFPA